jgi:hypothetical protein
MAVGRGRQLIDQVGQMLTQPARRSSRPMLVCWLFFGFAHRKGLINCHIAVNHCRSLRSK